MAKKDQPVKQLLEENQALRTRLEELEDTLRAIRRGEVDALVISDPQGEQVYTLKGANQPYRVLVETMNEGTATVAPDGIVLYSNSRLAAMLKMPLEQVIGTSMRLHVTDGDRSIFDEMLKNSLQTACQGELALKAGEETLPVQLSLSPVRSEEMDYIVIVIMDLTEQKKAEKILRNHKEILEEIVEKRTEELKRLSDELKRSNEDLKQFASAASHDLQEPLRGVEGFINLLKKRYKGKLDEKADEFIDYVVDDVKRMQMLIRDLLEYSRVSAKSKVFSPANCSVSLEQALSNLRAAIDESGAIVTYDLLPTVMGNDAQLSRLFQNLIGNAIKFRGKEPLKIHLSAHREGDEWIFSIRDTGIGIAPEQAERIFLIFQRLHSRQEYPGTGIGLAICKRIVEQHGGRIWVESKPGTGAAFYFTIPEKQGNLSAMKGKESSDKSSDS
jgi:PAS domain S-box-containing protein